MKRLVKKERAIALGNFDGVHLGHAAILRAAADLAKENGISSAALVFENEPDNFFAQKTVTRLLCDNALKEEQIRAFGIDDVLFLPFDEAFASLSPEDFVRLLAEKFGAKALVCGFDYRFGRQASGDAALLAQLGEQAGISVKVCPAVEADGEPVSATRIRALLSAGETESAAALLGRPFTVSGRVEPGRRIGRELGFPTINLHFAPDGIIPAFGVYATRVRVDGRWYLGVTNVGVRPTVDHSDRIDAETHLIGLNRELYGKTVRVAYYKHLRPERNFGSVAALKEAIRADVKETLDYFKNNALQTGNSMV